MTISTCTPLESIKGFKSVIIISATNKSGCHGWDYLQSSDDSLRLVVDNDDDVFLILRGGSGPPLKKLDRTTAHPNGCGKYS